MARYIDADALVEKIKTDVVTLSKEAEDDKNFYLDYIAQERHAPTVDVVALKDANSYLIALGDKDGNIRIMRSGSPYDLQEILLSAILTAYDDMSDRVASIFKNIMIETIQDDRFWERGISWRERRQQ